MSFVTATAVPASAVTTNGTITFGYPSIPLSGLRTDAYPFDSKHLAIGAAPQPLEQTSSGDFAQSNQHYAYAVGLQARLVYGVDFSLTFNDTIASGITFTYLGSATIPAGSNVLLELHMVGQGGSQNIFDNQNNRGRLNLMPMAAVRFGTPLAASATLVVNAAARAGTVLNTYANAVVLDCPRNLSVKSSTTDTTQKVTMRGLDEYGVAMTETFSLNGTTAVNGKKAFKTVISDQNDIALAGNLSVGTGVVLGLPFVLPALSYALGEDVDNAVPTRGTYVAADQTVPSATTGDVRGTYSPNTAPNAAHHYTVLAMVPDPNYLGLPQFAG